jgi:plastocyanin
MHIRLPGRCALVGVGFALTFCATAQGATREVSAGTFLRADAKAFEEAVGEANTYFVKRVTVRVGDRVRWENNGFHSITFSPRGAPRTPLIVPDTSTPIAGSLDAAGAPFWFNGQPRLIINPEAAVKQGGSTYRPGTLLNSGLPLAEGPPPPYTLRFNRRGTYTYYCIVHPGMEGSVKVVAKNRRIPSAAAVRREAIRQEKTVLRRVQRATTGTGAGQAPGVIQAGNDTNTFAIFKFFPAAATVKAGDTVTLQMPRRTGEVHTFSFGPIGTEAAPAYLDTIAANFIAPAPGAAGPPTLVVDPRAALPSENPAAGVPSHTATLHGNGFWNSGVLDSDPASAAIPRSAQVRFTTPGSYGYICLIHPFMRGDVTVTP